VPELPEVQTIVNDLNPKIISYKIIDFWSDWEKGVKLPINKFKKLTKQRKIISVRRIGKHIILDLDNQYSIVIHLKMTGHLLLKKSGDKSKFFKEKVNQYIHHIIYFENQSTLEFSDLRKFGWINLINTKELRNLKSIQKLGIDAVSQKFNLAKFKLILAKYPNKMIGKILLEQELISGIGNIYRSEILFDSNVLPDRIIKILTQEEIKKIHKSIKKILKLAIKMRGTSDSDYRDADGKRGNFQKVLQVYRRTGQNCKKCVNKIKRIKLAQRSAFFCKNCQV